MALDNLISVSFTEEEKQQMDNAMSVIETIMKGKAVSLTPKQRQQYGRVAYEMETWVNNAHGYMKRLPGLVPAYIDQAEHEADLLAHNTLNPRIDQLTAILQSMLDTNLLLGTDIYNNSMSFYRSLREAAKGNAVGAVPAYNDLKRQFPGRGKKQTEE